MNETRTVQPVDDQSPVPTQEDQTAKAVPIEVKWNLPAWMLRDPGKPVNVEDDDIDFQ